MAVCIVRYPYHRKLITISKDRVTDNATMIGLIHKMVVLSVAWSVNTNMRTCNALFYPYMHCKMFERQAAQVNIEM